MKVARMSFPFLLLFVTSIAREQTAVHVAPIEQCRADADAWSIPNTKPPAAWHSPEDEFNNFKSKMDVRAVSLLGRVFPSTASGHDAAYEGIELADCYETRAKLHSLVREIDHAGNGKYKLQQFSLEQED